MKYKELNKYKNLINTTSKYKLFLYILILQ